MPLIAEGEIVSNLSALTNTIGLCFVSPVTLYPSFSATGAKYILVLLSSTPSKILSVFFSLVASAPYVKVNVS